MKVLAYGVAVGLAAVTVASAVRAAEITGAGSTFVYPILSKWSADYNAKTGDKINYQSVGSGRGIAQIMAGTVDFGASDMPMKPDELAQARLAQFPIIIGGVVPVVNIEGIQPGQIKFTGLMLAEIYLGKIKKWNDPAIKQVNPNLKLPDAQISVVHRSDSSGTTFNWVNYLSKISEEWKSKVGAGTSVDWPTGIGGKGNEGVAAYVKRVPNSIGYVEYAHVLENTMTYGLVQNRTGQFISPNAGSFQAAAASADWRTTKDFYFIMTDAPGEQSYPVTATVFIIMHRQSKDITKAKAILDFFKWVLENGHKQARDLDYVPLPDTLVQQIEEYWKASISAGM